MVSSEIELPADYAELLEALKTRIAGARIRAQRTVNTLVIELYWSLGKDIIARQTSLARYQQHRPRPARQSSLLVR